MRLTALGDVAIMACLVSVAACATPSQEEQVQATYDKQTGKLSQLTINAGDDGKPNITSYMDGARFLRIEIDTNEDGQIDRWEYYGAGRELERVGFSRSNDGVVDSWAYQGADGLVSRVEISKSRDGRISRTEFYDKGVLVRAEEDTNGDGRIDKWETYDSGGLTTVRFDTKFSGTPDRIIDYRQESQSGPP